MRIMKGQIFIFFAVLSILSISTISTRIRTMSCSQDIFKSEIIFDAPFAFDPLHCVHTIARLNRGLLYSTIVSEHIGPHFVVVLRILTAHTNNMAYTISHSRAQSNLWRVSPFINVIFGLVCSGSLFLSVVH